MKILNLYAGIGGNRKLWGDEHEVTAVEYVPKIAEVYKKLYPKDTVVVGDAHQYLLEHFGEFDFIWSSPPCVTHTKMNIANQISPYKDNTKQIENGGAIKPRYPDMALYQEIIFLQNSFKGKWCVENVIAYYEPLIKPTETAKHWFWTNFKFPALHDDDRGFHRTGTVNDELAERRGFNMEDLNGLDKRKVLRNCCEPEIGKHILDWAFREEATLFS